MDGFEMKNFILSFDGTTIGPTRNTKKKVNVKSRTV